MNIVRIDMHIRDERLLEWLKLQNSEGIDRISSETIATEFKCHKYTALAMLKRLEQASYIRVIRNGTRGGYIYEVLDDPCNHN